MFELSVILIQQMPILLFCHGRATNTHTHTHTHTHIYIYLYNKQLG